MVTDGSSFRPHESVVSCDLDEGSALLDLRTSEYIKLNTTAALVWSWLAEGATVEQLATRMATQFEVSVDECRGDIVALLEQFLEAGLVERQVS